MGHQSPDKGLATSEGLLQSIDAGIIESTVDVNNTTSDALAGGATWTGTQTNILDYATINFDIHVEPSTATASWGR